MSRSSNAAYEAEQRRLWRERHATQYLPQRSQPLEKGTQQRTPGDGRSNLERRTTRIPSHFNIGQWMDRVISALDGSK